MTNKQMKNDCERWKTAEARKWKAKNFQRLRINHKQTSGPAVPGNVAHPNEEEFK